MNVCKPNGLQYWGIFANVTCNTTYTKCSASVRVLLEFPLLVPFIVLCPFLSLLLLTNQVPMISIKEGTDTVFILSLISEDIYCIR